MLHSYPHCWRCGTPLLYYAKPSWYIRTSLAARPPAGRQRQRRLAPRAHQERPHGPLAGEQRRLGAQPRALLGHAAAGLAQRGGRDGAASAPSRSSRSSAASSSTTRTGRSWTTSRSRRRPAASRCGASPRSSTSGSTPGRCRSPSGTAPFENQDKFDEQFPADYICEAIDQTRGWFYSLLAISTLLNDQSSYKTVLCLGHIADPQGRKMSKSLGNIVAAVGRHRPPRRGRVPLVLPDEQAAVGRLPVLRRHGRRVAAPVPAAAVEHVRLLRDVRERQRRRAGRRRAGQRPRPLGAVPPGRHRRDGHRAAGALRRHPRRPRHPGLRRRSLQLVRAPLAAPLLGRRPGRVRHAAHVPGDGHAAARAVHAVHRRRDLREPRRHRAVACT